MKRAKILLNSRRPVRIRTWPTCVMLCLLPFAAAQAEPESRNATKLVSPEAGAFSFGTAVAVLDFNGDGVRDIAVSDTREAIDGGGARGVVYIFVKTQFGYQAVFSFDLQSGSARFGATLAVGDFDEDGRDDLLIGVPGTGSGGGGVYLVRHIASDTPIQDGVILNGGPSGGGCGSSLAVADFNGDGNLDFVTGCPTASFDGFTSVGRLHFAYGNGAGGFSNQGFLSQETAGVAGGAETGDLFGAALAAGDFNCDGIRDLAIGVPNESADGGTATGALHVLLGASPGGLSGTGSQLWHQGSTGLPGTSGDGDHFASALAAGDFNRTNFFSSCSDLAVGIPDDVENPGGSVLVLDSASGGLVATGAQVLTVADFPPDSFAYPPRASIDANNRIGATLFSADLGRGRRPDLAIGVEGWRPILFGSASPGLVCVAFATPGAGLLGAGQRCYSGREFAGAANDVTFGSAIAAGKLDDADGNELVIGAPGTKQVFVLANGLFHDGFDGNAD